MEQTKAIGTAGALLAALLCGPARAATVDDALRAARYGNIEPLRARLGDILDPALATLARLEVDAAELDGATVRRDLTAYRYVRDNDPVTRARVWSLATSVSFATGDYAAAADAGARWCAALKVADPWHETADAVQEYVLAAILAKAPQMTVSEGKGHAVATSRDAAGLTRATATINGFNQATVLDTGADISTISASAAARMHLRMIDGDASVSSATRQAVSVRVGIADTFELAGVTLRNVAFLVLDDSQLQFPQANGYSIDAIVGAPVFRTMKSVTFAEGTFTPGLPTDATRSSPLRMSGGALYVAVRLDSIPLALHLDTGASASSLSPEFAREHPELIAGLPRSEDHVGGAGGVSAVKVARWRDVPVSIGGAMTKLPELRIGLTAPSGTSDWTLGAIGQDLLRQFQSYTIDFRTMRFAVASRGGHASAPQPSSPPAR